MIIIIPFVLHALINAKKLRTNLLVFPFNSGIEFEISDLEFVSIIFIEHI
jgi:hypothetical protein